MKNLLPSGDVQRITVKRDPVKGGYVTIAEIQTISQGLKKLKIGINFSFSLHSPIYLYFFQSSFFK